MATYVNKRTAHRWRLLAVMLGAVFCAFGSFWLLDAMRRADEGGVRGPHNEPDYIVENFSFVRMSETGQPSYLVSGKRLTHRPDSDISEVEQPVVQSMADEHPRMTITADNARIRHRMNQVDLIGNVDVVRPATQNAQAMHLRTEALTVLPDEEVIKTDQPIDMTLGTAKLRATGMSANNATQQVHLESRGQIVYPPRADR